MNSRKFLFEFEDLPWFPTILRESMTDYLRYMFTLTNFYEPITSDIIEAMKEAGSTHILDLCSGGGGPMQIIQRNLESKLGQPVPVTLTDKFPNTAAFQFLADQAGNKISFIPTPVDAAEVPGKLTGFRTIFSGFHHFDDELAKKVLQNAVDNKAGIGIFDGGDKNILTALLIVILHPLAFFFLTPFFRPFKLSRFFFTYILPLVPLFTIWDGIISVTRLRSPKKLLQLFASVDDGNYHYTAGKRRNRWGMRVAFLIAIPRKP
ncbi:MAG: class I SAM-dependent methyltransferase [Chitinophagaceae bacterium]|nr:MAG: class I SAM-dependent methyltransferase [Chitinophagaceae bacterium]